MSVTSRVLSKASNPRALGAAVLRRVVPNSPSHGFPWVTNPDGSVTFRERGFVAADGPSQLLARHNYETQRIRQELDGVKVDRSLELGCGFGRLSMTFAEHSGEHIAVDINNEALAAARTAYPQITFQQVAPGVLPFPDDHFELVCTWTVIQHIRPEMIRGMCSEILRVLAPGGMLLLCEESRPATTVGHTWARTASEYGELFAPLSVKRHGYIEEIARVPGMESPGEVMLLS